EAVRKGFDRRRNQDNRERLRRLRTNKQDQDILAFWRPPRLLLELLRQLGEPEAQPRLHWPPRMVLLREHRFGQSVQHNGVHEKLLRELALFKRARCARRKSGIPEW